MSRRCRRAPQSGSVTSSRGFQRQGETSASCMTVRARNQLVCCCLQGCRLWWASPITPFSSSSSSPAWGEKSGGQKASNAEAGKRGWKMVMGIPSREKPRNEMLIRSPPLPALDRSSRAGDHASSSASQSGWPCQTVELDIPYIPGQIQGENGRGRWGAQRVELTGPEDSRRLTASSRAMCCVGVPGRWWLTGSDGTKQRTSRKGKGVGRGRCGEGNPEAGRPGGFVKRSNSTGQCDDVPKKIRQR